MEREDEVRQTEGLRIQTCVFSSSLYPSSRSFFCFLFLVRCDIYIMRKIMSISIRLSLKELNKIDLKEMKKDDWKNLRGNEK